MRTPQLVAFVSLALFGSAAGGCASHEVVRGSAEPGIDAPALSTGLDKEDIQRMLKENLDNLRSAPIMDEWRSHRAQDTVAIFPFSNRTSEHIDGQLDAILSEAETWMVESNTVTMIDRQRRTQAIAEIEGSQHPIFNPNRVAQYGKQLGVKYYITGDVSTADERTEDMRRVQYFFFMKVIEVETSAIRWQHKAYVTKAIR